MWWHRKKAGHVAVRELVDGVRARVVGRAAAVSDGSLGAPYTGRSCLAFKAHLFTFTYGTSYSNHLGAENAVVFDVTDDTGRVRVVGPSWRVELEEHVVTPNTTVGDAHRPFGLGVLVRHANPDAALPTGTTFHEGLLQVGELVAVTGTARRSGDGWELVSSAGEFVLISSDPRQLER
jgi:hypothetical protein